MNAEEQPIKNLTLEELLPNVDATHKLGYRLVQVCCTKIGENSFEITYSFDKDMKFANLRVTVGIEAELPSITGIYPGAFLYENEIRELFGVQFKGISVDYKGHLYKKKVENPYNEKKKVQ